MHKSLPAALLLMAGPALARKWPYLDSSLPVGCRVDDLVGRITLEEGVGQLTRIDVLRPMGRTEWDRGPLNPEWMERVLARRHVGSLLGGGGNAPVPDTPGARMTHDLQRYATQHSRPRIPILYGLDAVHGHSSVVGAAIFPHNLGLGATLDAEVPRQRGAVTARARRATGITSNFAPGGSLSCPRRCGCAALVRVDLPGGPTPLPLRARPEPHHLRLQWPGRDGPRGGRGGARRPRAARGHPLTHPAPGETRPLSSSGGRPRTRIDLP